MSARHSPVSRSRVETSSSHVGVVLQWRPFSAEAMELSRCRLGAMRRSDRYGWQRTERRGCTEYAFLCPPNRSSICFEPEASLLHVPVCQDGCRKNDLWNGVIHLLNEVLNSGTPNSRCSSVEYAARSGTSFLTRSINSLARTTMTIVFQSHPSCINCSAWSRGGFSINRSMCRMVCDCRVPRTSRLDPTVLRYRPIRFNREQNRTICIPVRCEPRRCRHGTLRLNRPIPF